MKKYGLKKVCDNKFVEFLSSLFAYSHLERVKLFLGLLGGGEKVKARNYSKSSIILGVNLWRSLVVSKVGVVLNIDESADKIFFPTLRAHECLRERLEGVLSKGEMHGLLTSVD